MAGFSFESLHTALGNHESVTQPKPTTLQQLLTTCIFSPANTTNLAWDGSKIVSVNGTSFDTMEATDYVYGGGTPSEIGLTVPLILDGVTFASPSPKSF